MRDDQGAGAMRDLGQRWLRWINDSPFPCPPFGWFVITSAEMIGSELVFHGTHNDAEGQLVDYGVPWNAGFNSVEAVQPGDEGRWTCDLPTWCLLDGGNENHDDPLQAEAAPGGTNNLMAFRTYDPYAFGSPIPWTLSPTGPDVLEAGVPDDSHLWTGYRVFATRLFPELSSIWQEQFTFLSNFRVGFVGGLVTFLRGGGV